MQIIKGRPTQCLFELNRIFKDAGFNFSYPADDDIGGRIDPGLKPEERNRLQEACLAGRLQNQFPLGSISREEGQLLYSMVRHLNPESIIEIGTWYGCSTTHIAKALKDARSKIKVLAIDNIFDASQLGLDNGDGMTIGALIPAEYKPFVDIRIGNMEDEMSFLKNNSVDFIFEDSLHTYYTTYYIVNKAKEVLKPGGFLVMHDVLFPGHGAYSDGTVTVDMERAFKDTGILDSVYACLLNDSNTGVGIWRKQKK